MTGAALVVEDEITEENSLRQVLHWIGFRTAAQKQALVNDCFTSWIDLRMLSEKDASTMEKSFSSRTNADGRLIFGTTRTKYIKAVIHWIQDFYRVSDVPSIIGLSEITFKTQLQRALTRSMIRKNLKDQVSSTADAATPGPLLKENQWKEWEEKFDREQKAREHRENLREQRLRQKEMERLRSFDNDEKKIDQKVVSGLQNFDIDKTSEN